MFGFGGDERAGLLFGGKESVCLEAVSKLVTTQTPGWLACLLLYTIRISWIYKYIYTLSGPIKIGPSQINHQNLYYFLPM